MMHISRGSGGLEYLLLLGGACIVAILILFFSIQFLAPAKNIVGNNLVQFEDVETILDDDGSGDDGNGDDENGEDDGGDGDEEEDEDEPYCGNGLLESPEQCDVDVGASCIPAYESTCQWCTLSCQWKTELGGECGDSICQTPNESTVTCPLDCGDGPVCGDGIVNQNEECDPLDDETGSKSCILPLGIPGTQVCSPNTCSYGVCEPAEGIYLLENNKMGLAFEQDAQGNISLFKIIHKLGSIHYSFDVESLPFLLIETRSIGGSFPISSQNISDLDCTTSLKYPSAGKLRIEWEDCSVGGDVEDNAFDIQLDLELKSSESFSRWRITVDNRMSDYSLRSIGFQMGVKTLTSGKDYGLITPFWLLEEPSAYTSEMIPSNVIANDLAFRLPFAYYDKTGRGLYIDHRTPFPSDNLGNKWWNDDGDHYWYAFTYFPSSDNAAGNDYVMNWDTVLGVFEGDWYDLAQIQRATLESEDILDKKLSSRADIPLFWKEADLSILRPGGWETSSEEVSDVQSIVDYYNAPNIHLYYPGAVGNIADDLGDFDNFPGLLSTTFNQLKQQGIRTSTYTHSRGIGKNTDAATLIKNTGKACKDITGSYLVEDPYLPADIGSFVNWGAFYAWTVAQDFFDAGLSGAFADNPFSFPFLTCYGDPSHPDGPGPHHMAGVVVGISEMRKAAKALNPDFIVFYEGVNEFLIPLTDAGPSSVPLRRYDSVGILEDVIAVPFYEVMIHDYIPQLGFPIFYEATPEALKDYELLDPFIAGSFAWGQVITIGEYYMGPQNVPIHDIETVFDIDTFIEAKLLNDNAEYVKELVALKKDARKYLSYGRMLRPLDVEEQTLIADGAVIYPGGVATNVEIENQVPVVWSTVWRASDGDTALVFANYNDADKTVQFDIDFFDYGLSGTYNLRDIQSGEIIGVLVNGDNSIIVSAKSGLILELE